LSSWRSEKKGVFMLVEKWGMVKRKPRSSRKPASKKTPPNCGQMKFRTIPLGMVIVKMHKEKASRGVARNRAGKPRGPTKKRNIKKKAKGGDVVVPNSEENLSKKWLLFMSGSPPT